MELHRAKGLIDLKVVRETKIVIVGLGSLGSFLASFLIYPWRELVLMDREALEEENIERHLLGRTWLHAPKVQGVATYLRDFGLNNVVYYARPVEEVIDKHKDANLIILATGEDRISLWVNQWNTYGIPLLVAGVYPGGLGGEVVLVPDPRQVCFVCAQFQIGRLGGGFREGNYGVPAPTAEAVPGLRPVIAEVAAMAASFALDLIEGKIQGPRLIRSFRTWSQFLLIREGGEKVKRAVESWADQLVALGVVPNVAVEEGGEGTSLLANGQRVVNVLTRWESCPFHKSRAVSLAEI